MNDAVLIILSEKEFSGITHEWGTGGWVEPEEREGLDWFTLIRWLGWSVEAVSLTASDFEEVLNRKHSCIILADNPDSLNDKQKRLIQGRLKKEKTLFIQRAEKASTQKHVNVAGISWQGPGIKRTRKLKNEIQGQMLKAKNPTEIWAAFEGGPLVTANLCGPSSWVRLGFHPSRVRDADFQMTAFLKHMLIFGQKAPVAWVDWDKTLVLRMDDPGGAQNIYNESWYYPELRKEQWEEIARDLKQRDARLSIAYISGWVDDGDVRRGKLRIAGKMAEREAGKIHPSTQVHYVDQAGFSPGIVHDYESEFEGIEILRKKGLGDIELHGFTHMYPDLAEWSASPDKYENVDWYRELGGRAKPFLGNKTPEEYPLAIAMKWIQEDFKVRPTTLISPGEEWTTEVIDFVRGLGIELISSYYLAFRNKDVYCWSMHVQGPYLNLPGTHWFDGELPVIGYFHDRELSLEGIQWMSRYLDEWESCGAKRILDFREVAAVLNHRVQIEEKNGKTLIHLTNESELTAVRPFPVRFYLPESTDLASLSFHTAENMSTLSPEFLENGIGEIFIGPKSESSGHVKSFAL